MAERANSVIGFSVAPSRHPTPRLKVSWDPVTHLDYARMEIIWWCIGENKVKSSSVRYRAWYLIDALPGETYVVAIRAHYMEAFYLPSPWAYVVVEVPHVEDKSQYTDLGQVTVIDTPRGPAILLDELWKACG